eukprot:TRINITY_DN102552_c0_g1_i1.p1 TRINITY_DN102552_c0_g1~~TRINITY_DN102552_c0_g1_i1.p1  ORF type:complete len:521 (+),score=75.92 TRINITY_DN102552_c0_g1_i1:219-1781(+)
MSGQRFVVKNTFVEVNDHKSLKERSDGWRRQSSEPAKMFGPQSQQDTMSEMSSDSEDGGDGLLLPPHIPLTELPLLAPESPKSPVSPILRTTPPESDVHPSCAYQEQQRSAPQVLRLGDSIPPPQKTPSREQWQHGKDHKKDSYINSLKNLAITDKLPPWTNVTTVMMRNLPNKYTQAMLLEELEDAGFRPHHDYDFLYLPMDHSNAANLGYCFINFVETPLANSFAAAFQGKKMRKFNSNKTVTVMPASIQGYEKNYAYYSSTRVAQAEDPAYRPLFLRTLPAAHSGSTGISGKHPSSRGGAPGGASGKSQKDALNKSSHAATTVSFGGKAKKNSKPAAVPASEQPMSANASRLCTQCGTDVGPSHRFCAFCGAFVGGQQVDATHVPSSLLPPTGGVEAAFHKVGLPRAGNPDGIPAPLLNPSLALRFEGQGGGMPSANTVGLQQQVFANRQTENVSAELDVMRGREMLLAALEDMENRDGGLWGGYSQYQAPMAFPFGSVCSGAMPVGIPQVALAPWC